MRYNSFSGQIYSKLFLILVVVLIIFYQMMARKLFFLSIEHFHSFVKIKKVPKLFFGIVTIESSKARRETMYDLWIQKILEYGHDYIYCTEKPLEPKFKWIPVKNWTEYWPRITNQMYYPNRDRENKRISMANYFLQTDSDFFINPTDDVFVDSSRINQFAKELGSKYDTENDLILKGNCMLNILHGGSGYIMTRKMASIFVNLSERWTRESAGPDDIEMNRFLKYVNLTIKDGASPYMSGRAFQLLSDSLNLSICKKNYTDYDCNQPIYKLEDCYMMHPTGNYIPENIKIWNRYLKLIEDKKHHYGWYSTANQLHEVCIFD